MADDNKLVNGGRGGNFGLGIDWTFPNLHGLINNRGEDVIHETGMRCVCNSEDTYAGQTLQTHVPRRREVNCQRCRGDGFIFRNPRKIVGLVTGIRQNKDRLEGGWAEPGDCTFSPRPGYEVAAGDLITFPWGQPVPDGQVVTRGMASQGDNSQRKTNLEDNEDRLWYSSESAIWCEDEDGNVYKEGDFILDGSKIIRWVGSKPRIGQRYVIKYNAYLEWVVFQPPDIRRDRNRDLGIRVLLRKRHVALVNEDPRPRLNDRVPFCNRIQGC